MQGRLRVDWVRTSTGGPFYDPVRPLPPPYEPAAGNDPQTTNSLAGGGVSETVMIGAILNQQEGNQLENNPMRQPGRHLVYPIINATPPLLVRPAPLSYQRSANFLPPAYSPPTGNEPTPTLDSDLPPAYTGPVIHEPLKRLVYYPLRLERDQLHEGRHLLWPTVLAYFPFATGNIIVPAIEQFHAINGFRSRCSQISVNLKSRQAYDVFDLTIPPTTPISIECLVACTVCRRLPHTQAHSVLEQGQGGPRLREGVVELSDEDDEDESESDGDAEEGSEDEVEERSEDEVEERSEDEVEERSEDEVEERSEDEVEERSEDEVEDTNNNDMESGNMGGQRAQ